MVTEKNMNLTDKELIELIEDIQFADGDIEPGERKFTEAFKSDNQADINEKKLVVVGSPEPGAKVEIYWKKSWGFPDPDYGYIFTLPIGSYGDDDDIFVAGIIHIPNPQGGEKTAENPEWGHIDRYLDNENIVKVKIIEDIE